jgi:hypothetical protein
MMVSQLATSTTAGVAVGVAAGAVLAVCVAVAERSGTGLADESGAAPAEQPERASIAVSVMIECRLMSST